MYFFHFFAIQIIFGHMTLFPEFQRGLFYFHLNFTNIPQSAKFNSSNLQWRKTWFLFKWHTFSHIRCDFLLRIQHFGSFKLKPEFPHSGFRFTPNLISFPYNLNIVVDIKFYCCTIVSLSLLCSAPLVTEWKDIISKFKPLENQRARKMGQGFVHSFGLLILDWFLLLIWKIYYEH